jgi:hypothetical protein
MDRLEHEHGRLEIMTDHGNIPRKWPAAAWIGVLTAAVLFAAGCGGETETGSDQSRRSDLVPESVSPADGGVTAQADSLAEAGAGTLAELEPAGGEATTPPASPEAPVGEAGASQLPEVVPAVPPAGYRAPGSAAGGPVGQGPYCVQVGAFRDAERAQQRRDQVVEFGLTAVLDEAKVDGVTYHRVIVPNLADLPTANNLADRLRRELGVEALVRKL